MVSGSALWGGGGGGGSAKRHCDGPLVFACSFFKFKAFFVELYLKIKLSLGSPELHAKNKGPWQCLLALNSTAY